MIRLIATDWDGTVVDSVKKKTRAFGQTVVEHIPKLRSVRHLVESIYYVTGGTSRRYQLAAAAAIGGQRTLKGAAYDAWSAAFTEAYNRRKPQLFPDVVPALNDIKRELGIYLAVSSSVPQHDLDATVLKYRELREVFSTVYGTIEKERFKKGKPHLDRLSAITNVPVSEIMFVGDMVEDIRLGKKAGAITVARLPRDDRGLAERLEASKPDYVINSFADLREHALTHDK